MRLCSLMLLSALAVAAPGTDVPRPWLEPGQPIAQRVAALLAAMTVEEKIAQINHDCPDVMDWSTVPYNVSMARSFSKAFI
jgi:hypothetical protein